MRAVRELLERHFEKYRSFVLIALLAKIVSLLNNLFLELLIIFNLVGANLFNISIIYLFNSLIVVSLDTNEDKLKVNK